MGNKQGFTLIEIIVVLIILGVLAALSLSTYFNWIERSRLPEAISLLKSLNDQMTACRQTKSADECIAQMPFGIPSTEHFLYEGQLPAIGNPRWMIWVGRLSAGSGVTPGGPVRCSGLAGTDSAPSAHSLVAICHNYNGDGSNSFTGSGYYQGIS